MTLVGCVVAIRPKELLISLPNSLKGIVNTTQVSSIYAKAYEEQSSGNAVSRILNIVLLLLVFVKETTRFVYCHSGADLSKSKYNFCSTSLF